MRRNSTFGVRGAGAFEHDGSDPISSIGNTLGDVYVDTDTAGDGSAKTVAVSISADDVALFTASLTRLRSLNVDANSSTELLRMRGDSIAKTSAPSRGGVSRDNICFAWGRISVDVTGNTATLTEGHNVNTVTWISDDNIDVTFHNTASSSSMSVVGGTNITAKTVNFFNIATTGFRADNSPAAGANYSISFVVFLKDLT